MAATGHGLLNATTGGGACLRRSFVVAALMVVSTLSAGAAGSQTAPVSVRRDGAVYRVAASFVTAQTIEAAHAVLTDYEGIPRYMPDVRTSRVLERDLDRIVVEQQAVARVLFFSKQIRLVLEVREGPVSIRFRDRSGASFVRYEGAWSLRQESGQAVIDYELVAQPAFDVPEFMLTRLLRRDAGRMIERLQAEITARGSR